MRVFAKAVVAVLVVSALAGCEVLGDTFGWGRITVTYEANGAEEGTVPVDETFYASGEEIVMPGNTGNLSRSGYPFFVGWSESVDASTGVLTPGSSLIAGDEDLQLFAVWLQESLVSADDGQADDQFGTSVATDGNTLVVGAIHDDDEGTDAGAVYVFQRSGGNTWTVAQKLVAPDAAADAEFGTSVAVSGDRLIVGAAFADSGAAYVFERGADGTWLHDATLSFPGSPGPDARAGWAVAIDGDHAVVGAPGGNDLAGPNVDGAAAVFFHDGSTWDDGTVLGTGDAYGFSVGIDGERIAVGDFGADPSGSNSGAAYVFERSGANNWGSGTEVAASGLQANDWFGYSVAISGDVLAVGAVADDGPDNSTSASGAAYVFRFGELGWGSGVVIRAEGAEPNEFFGHRVGAADGYVLVGTHQRPGGPGNDPEGFARLYEDSDSGWTEALTRLGRDANFRFGYSMALGESSIVIGEPLADDRGATSGAVEVWRYR